MRGQTYSGADHVADSDYVPSFGNFVRFLSQSSIGYLRRTVVGIRSIASRDFAQPRDLHRGARRFFRRHVLTFANFLALLWIIVLFWGEVSIYDRSVEQCDWAHWEQWPPGATPHHLVFVADPQLVDPHTYPGRPWPLSSLTITYTDLYMQRAYSRIHRDLDPHTIMFLGDLFDGGREWGTPRSQSPDPRYQKYGGSYWFKEYDRFSRIFLRNWKNHNPHEPQPEEHTRVIASLPGNHDLGFGVQIQLPVRERFNAVFGDSNRIDIVGNHTFVSVDTVSLSAKEQDNSHDFEDIWMPTEKFLDDAQSIIARKIGSYVRVNTGEDYQQYMREPVVEEIQGLKTRPLQKVDPELKSAELPMVVLSHVPLYRDPGTPCGPLREKYPPQNPPAGQDGPVIPDEPNSIRFGGGYQYQNCLTPATTLSMLQRLGGQAEYVFSGDDHDYCEVLHRAYPSAGSGIREITVKSLSWAMGVRRPGFLLVTLWNEITPQGKRIDPHDSPTLQTKLCLLPDQLAVFLRYAAFLAATWVLILAWATITTFIPGKLGTAVVSSEDIAILLPMYRAGNDVRRKDANSAYELPTISKSHVGPPNGSSTSSEDSKNLASRSSYGRTRSASPIPSYGYGLGTSSTPPPVRVGPMASYGYGNLETLKKKTDDFHHELESHQAGVSISRRKPSTKGQMVLFLWVRAMLNVAMIAFPWYIFLLYYR